jgi:hypothetical protein
MSQISMMFMCQSHQRYVKAFKFLQFIDPFINLIILCIFGFSYMLKLGNEKYQVASN